MFLVCSCNIGPVFDQMVPVFACLLIVDLKPFTFRASIVGPVILVLDLLLFD